MTATEFVAAGLNIEQANHEMRKRVFGHDYKTDRNGKPIETGIGAPGNESEHHFAAILKYEGKAAADAARAKAKKKD
jgi:hypothetical protein